jgi:hypothetical protein
MNIKKILTVFFVGLGVIFFLIIIALTYFFIVDPLNIRPLLVNLSNVEQRTIDITDGQSTPTETEVSNDAQTTDPNTLLTPTQEKALELIGVDPASLPSVISPGQEACFISILGETRVAEIKAGDTPTAREFFRARACVD